MEKSRRLPSELLPMCSLRRESLTGLFRPNADGHNNNDQRQLPVTCITSIPEGVYHHFPGHRPLTAPLPAPLTLPPSSPLFCRCRQQILDRCHRLHESFRRVERCRERCRCWCWVALHAGQFVMARVGRRDNFVHPLAPAGSRDC